VTLPDAADPARPDACSACGGPLDPLGRCAKCGAVFGEAYRCPLCQALSDVEPSEALYFRCRTCGGPRVPPSAVAPSEQEIALLKTARAEQLRAGAFRAGAGFALASGVLSVVVTAVVLLATSPALVAKVAAFVASLTPLVLAALAFQRSAAHTKKLAALLQQAWLAAASRVALHEGPELSAAGLAKTLRIDEARAELLLAEVSVQNFVAGRSEPQRLRVTELADPAELGENPELPRAHAEPTKP